MLVTATRDIPMLRAMIDRAVPRPDLDGLFCTAATSAELGEMYRLVESLMSGTRSRRRLEILDGLLADLSTSVDGF
jgi:hypothetical protein